MEEFTIPPPRTNYLNAEYGIKSWLLTKDHKRIALLYLGSVSFFFLIGSLYAMAIRLELLTPQGDLTQSSTYNKIFTQHGIIMVFFFLIPAIPATLGNFLVPMMIGAKDLAFPRINLLSWYIYMAGGIITIYALLAGGVDTGWTFYTPYSTTFSNSYVLTTGVGIFITGFSSILTGLNFIVTIHTMRAPGMTWYRLPLFIWAHYATSLIMILGTPVIAITVLLLAFERLAHIGIFDPAAGGDPVLFQHLFWFYSHPAVYIMVLPAMGVVSELIANFSRKNVFGYKFVCRQPVGLRRHDFFVPEFCCRHSLSHQGLQLDSDPVQRIDLVRHAHALRLGLHRSLHNRWHDWDVFGSARDRCSFKRYVFHRGALPLHYGRRHVAGVSRRTALLVAENFRAHVSRRLGTIFSTGRVRRIQSDVLAAIRARLHGHAAALSHLSGGHGFMAGAPRVVYCGRVDSGRRLIDSVDLSCVVFALWTDCRIESVALARTRMADAFAAPD
jgi:hypothetical protein